MCYKILHYFVDISLDEFFTDSHDKITRSNSFELIMPNSRADARADIFSVRFIYIWNRLSDEIVNASSVPTFKRLLKTDFIISSLTAYPTPLVTCSQQNSFQVCHHSISSPKRMLDEVLKSSKAMKD